jgi:predicted metal-dependent hydrolase
MEALLRKGIEEFNSQLFFEAHDTWEELWREMSGHSRLFVQGLIQTAVGLYHLENGNIRGARSQLGKALNKIDQFLPACQGIDTENLAAQLRVCLRDVEQYPDLAGGQSAIFHIRHL